MGTQDEPQGPSFEPPEQPDPAAVPQPTGIPAPSAPGGRRARLWAGAVRFRWPLVIAGVLVVAVLVALVAGGVGGGDAPMVGGKAAAARTADRVPRGPVVRNIPFDCGMSPALLTRLVPGSDKEEQKDTDSDGCTWETGDIAWSLGGGNRVLKVKVTKDDDADPGPVAAAVETFSEELTDDERASPGVRPGAVTPVTGLGRMAVQWHFTEQDGPIFPGQDRPKKVIARAAGSTVLLWAGNVTATVSYSGADYPHTDPLDTAKPKPKVLPEKTTRAAALRAAAQVARAMRLPVGTPDVASKKHSPLIEDVPATCKVLPKSVTAAMSDYASDPETEQGQLFDSDRADVEADGCRWNVPPASLYVTIAKVTDPHSGGEVRTARLKYLELYHDAREGRPDEPPGDHDPLRYFHPLRGLGDRAFMHFERDTITGGGEAQVVYQVSNVLIRVRYRSIDENAFTPDEALNRVYSVAHRVAGQVHR